MMRRLAVLGLLCSVLVPSASSANVIPQQVEEHRISTPLPFDFNADGYGDLAVAAPAENERSGVVHVIYGSPKGLTSRGDQLWSQESPGVKGHARPFDFFGKVLASGDFDGDGYGDLAIGVPALREAGGPSGQVAVLYGSGRGLTSRDQVLSARAAGFSDGRWGAVLVGGDFDGDSYSDLAIGDQRGRVVIVPGSPAGLLTRAARQITQSTPGVPGDPGDGFFGDRLAVGNLIGDARDDLLVASRTGLYVLPGSPDGVVGAGSKVYGRDLIGTEPLNIGGLLIADFNGDGFNELSVGFDESVRVMPGSPTGPLAAGAQTWSQDSPGIPGDTEGPGAPGDPDWFGSALAAGDFDADGISDLVVGAFGEASGPTQPEMEEGAVNIIYGSSEGLTARNAQLWSQDAPGIKGGSEGGDWFGYSLRTGRFGRTSADSLAIGVPYESIRISRTFELSSAGAVNVIYGRPTDGLTHIGDQLWSQNAAGIKGQAEHSDEFGSL